MLLGEFSDAGWPSPWTADRIDAVLETLQAVHSTRPPAALPRLSDRRAVLSGWRRVAEEPEEFLGSRECSRPGWYCPAAPGCPQRQPLFPRRAGSAGGL